MNLALWILQVLWAVAFVGSGAAKIVQDRQQLQARSPYVEDLSDAQLKVIGALELAGGVGLVLPAATGIVTVLTPLAAFGLAIVMIGAMALHARRREPQGVLVTAVLFVVAAVIAWGRFGPYPV